MKILKNKKKNIFIIGSKGIPAKYGGFETFVEQLTLNKMSDEIQYHVSCMVDKSNYDKSKNTFYHNNARCFNIKSLNIGPAKAIIYDINSLQHCIKYIKQNDIKEPIIYILACRIGPVIRYYKNIIKKLGGQLYVNPDGHEWKRSKWSAPVRVYWKLSERLMVKYADLLVCDSKNIERYIIEDYKKYSPKTKFIAYGSEINRSILDESDKSVCEWYINKNVKPNKYYLVVGRFVPENNYEVMIREFMKSDTDKDFVLITNVSEKFLEKLKKSTKFESDNRIKFVGTVYEQELLKKIRENAYGYFHGHEVGGTNPSLLESLSSTKLNLLLDVGFNREVAEESSIYWSKEEGNLAKLINRADKMSNEEINFLGELAKKRIKNEYSWNYIVKKYEETFLDR